MEGDSAFGFSGMEVETIVRCASVRITSYLGFWVWVEVETIVRCSSLRALVEVETIARCASACTPHMYANRHSLPLRTFVCSLALFAMLCCSFLHHSIVHLP